MAGRLVTRAQSRVPARIARLAAAAIPADEEPFQIGLVGPGGSGSTEVLAAIADRLGDHVDTVVRVVGRRLEQEHPFGALSDLVEGEDSPDTSAAERRWRDLLLARLPKGDAVLLVDEAQWLDPPSLRVLVGVAERAADRQVTVVAAHRPCAGDPQLAALDAALSRQQPLIWLGPLDEADVAERAALVLGTTVDAAMVETVHEQTAGVQGLVDHMVLAGVIPAQDSSPPGVGASSAAALPAAMIEAVRAEVDQLPEATRTVLAALSAGAELDDELLGSVTELAAHELGDAVEQLRAAGLVVADSDDVVPVVAAAVHE
ncbi:MAG: hypothetical protein ACRD2C_01925, partial [Acidimicrobiales bacterium]